MLVRSEELEAAAAVEKGKEFAAGSAGSQIDRGRLGVEMAIFFLLDLSRLEG